MTAAEHDGDHWRVECLSLRRKVKEQAQEIADLKGHMQTALTLWLLVSDERRAGLGLTEAEWLAKAKKKFNIGD